MEEKSYLDNLRFDKKLASSAIAHYLTNFRYVILLTIAIIAAGAFSFINLPRRVNPEVKIPIVSIVTALPGASPQDVESLLTIPIEDEVAGLDNVNTITSTSAENFSQVAVEFKSGTNPDKARDDVKAAVDTITTLPEEAQIPNVQKLDFENQPVWTFLVTTNNDEATLLRFGENLKKRLENISSVKKVSITGVEEEEIQVLVKPNVQADFGIDPLTISRQIQSSVKSQPAGNIQSNLSTFALTIDPTTTSVSELRDLHLNVNGQIVRLGDVATIAIKSKPNQAKAFFADPQSYPQRAITFSIFKSENANIDSSVASVKKETETALSQYNGNFKLLSIVNLADQVDKQFTDLLGSFRDTIILVIVVLFLFLGLRQALIVAFCIPLSFLVSFTVMNILGLTINFLSLFSLILALGLLVDDAIVVVTAVTTYWKTKKFTPNETGLLVLRDFFVPIWSTTLTAVWAFLPILIATGIIGEFIKSISIVVSATLIASTAIAILITLPMTMVFLKPKFPNRVKLLLWFSLFAVVLASVVVTSLKSPFLPINVLATLLLITMTFIIRHELILAIEKISGRFVDTKNVTTKFQQYATHGVVDSTKLSKFYENTITKVLSSRANRNKTLFIVITFAIFSYALIPLGFVKSEFFPNSNEDTIYANVELPQGTNLEIASQEAQNLLGDLRQIKDVKYVTAESAKSISSEDFFDQGGGQNTILLTMVLTEKQKRHRTSGQIASEVRSKYENYYRGKVNVVEVSGGPPAGSDLQIKVLGDSSTKLNDYANQIIFYLETRPGITNVQKSIKPGSGKLVFVPDKQKMAQAQVTEQDLGFALRTYASGFALDSDINLDGEKKDITFRTSSTLQSTQTISSLMIKTQAGQVPLSSLGTLEFKSTPAKITREDRKRTIAVSAKVEKSSQIPTENKDMEKFANTLNLTNGYSWKTGGVNDENQKSVNSIFQAMIIAFILITATMVLQFGSFRKAFIVLLKIPLAISGVFIVFALTQTPLSFPTLIGILALFGITVYHSMLIIDKINKNLKSKMKLKHAIADGAASRVEPILFGTITTVVGLIPITLSDPLWRGLGGAIIAGLLFSGLLMLLFIPVVYYKIYEKEEN